MSISDNADSTDTFIINMNLSPAIAVRSVEVITADNSNSGFITQDTSVSTGIVIVGDDGSNKQLKGYLSFNLSSLYEI